MITNAAGEVAIAYHQPAPVLIDAGRMPSQRAYVFAVQRAVSLAWIAAGDVEAVLAMRGGCCGQRRRLFDYATPGQVSVWTNGSRGPDTERDKGG